MNLTLRINRSRKARATDPALRKLLKQGGLAALKKTAFAGETAEVSLLLTDDPGIRELNRDYRGRDAVTDVLSFAQQEGDPGFCAVGDAVLLGDIVIDTDRCALQAEQYGHSYERELVFLFLHGLLHLLGYDHERGEREEKIMFALQDELLAELF